MILVKLRGGLSNQMFQYAAARRLAAVHGTSVRIDASWYDDIPAGATPRSYELPHLRITGSSARWWEMIGTEGVRNTPPHSAPIALYRKFRPRYRFVGERHFHFDPDVLTLPDNVCLFGYWVSEKYFADVKDLIREEFAFRHPPSSENQEWLLRMADTNSVAVHVRRTDYASDPTIARIFGQLSAEYYATCIDHMRSAISQPTFYIFSDDSDWAKRNLLPSGDSRYHYVDHNSGASSFEDLRLMSSAQHQIIANSSFSWWGAWLNTNPSKVVCAPQRWLLDDAYDTRDVLPDGWLTLC